MGFKYKTISNKRAYYEQPRIIHQRHAYLRRMRRNRTEGKPVVYLNETWANAHDGKKKAWVEEDKTTKETIGRVEGKSGNGERLIVFMWVARMDGFLSKKGSSTDYHQEMNATNFEKWFQGKLLPALPASTIIVIDNASYHSCHLEEQPKQKWRKVQMKEWLDSRGITYPEKLLKKDLWDAIKKSQTPPVYVIDKIAEEKGHEVVRLPVAQCELSPIEMAWSQVKHHVRDNNNKP